MFATLTYKALGQRDAHCAPFSPVSGEREEKRAHWLQHGWMALLIAGLFALSVFFSPLPLQAEEGMVKDSDVTIEQQGALKRQEASPGFFARLAAEGWSFFTGSERHRSDSEASDIGHRDGLAERAQQLGHKAGAQNARMIADKSEQPPLKVPPELAAPDVKEETQADALAERLADVPGATSVEKNPIRKAILAYRQKRVGDAVDVLEQSAEDGSFIARFLLAHIYRTGKAGDVNHAKAYQYYHQITSDFADNGSYYTRITPFVAHAYVQLARYREIGVEELNIQPDPLVARILFEKAAHFGDVEGQYQLGRFLIETGQVRNIKLGQRWLTRAAIKNNPKAQAYLGALYWQGDLVKRKQSLALAWIEFARRNATGSVKEHVERLYEAVRYDLSEDEQTMAALYIGKLRSKYNVLWREVPARANSDRELLDGIVLAEPPQGLDVEQLEDKTPHNQLPELGRWAKRQKSYGYTPRREGHSSEETAETYGDNYRQNEASSFGFQMFGFGARSE